jgi:excisionase family DNA binding protein
VYNLIARGEIRSVSIGSSRRIPVAELERLVDVGGGDGDAAA